MILFFVLVLASVFVGILIHLMMMAFNPSAVDSVGTKRWFNSKGDLHREDGPAVVWYDGYKDWYQNGKRHRLDGPAIEGPDGLEEWWIEGSHITEQEFLARTGGSESTMMEDKLGNKEWYNSKNQLHRLDGPAIEYRDGQKEWWVNGKRHREDGPAIEYRNGGKAWYQDGKLHRTDGPAALLGGGHKGWYLNGVELTEQEFLARTSFNTPADWYAIALKDKKFQDAHLKYEKQQFQRCAIPELALNGINKSNYHK